jgi:hypothetical protein
MSLNAGNGGVDRRQILHGAAVAAASSWAGSAAHARGQGRVAVVFVSRSSNTRMLAGHLARSLDADLIEVRPRDPWPDDYEEMVAWATRWRESNLLLPLAPVTDLSGHSTVYLGFPIWGMALPAPMRSFLSGMDLTGKVVLPFITHGGYGVGSALDELHGLAPGAAVTEPFVLKCDQERDNLDDLRDWLAKIATDIPTP